ncbi:hypothetical protein KP509_16G080900 [Ceratopteris richardii]|uniref:Uncharacterized protein n=1 Tax=Ceratopteris richardii TaxID=49495 RepID=A0A8T2T0B4_CERRI|nr:hypothetical protein KP509_16G080900 [Ceratopteris richardii]
MMCSLLCDCFSPMSQKIMCAYVSTFISFLPQCFRCGSSISSLTRVEFGLLALSLWLCSSRLIRRASGLSSLLLRFILSAMSSLLMRLFYRKKQCSERTGSHERACCTFTSPVMWRS